MPFSPQSLSVLSRGGDFTLWRYQSADDPAALLAAGYFSPAAGILRRGDLISCVGAAAEQRTALLVADAGPGRVVLEPLQSLPPAALAALADVRVAEPTADEVLTFADGGWTNRPAAGRAGDAFAAAHAGAAGADAHAVATPACAGFMAAADKQKLDAIEAGATGDQTGAELVEAIDGELGTADWRQGASAWGEFHGKALGSALIERDGAIDVDVASVVASVPRTRAISGPAGEDPSISLELPAAVDRRDFLLAFSATGAVTTTKVATAADMDALVQRGLTTVENVAALRNLRPSSSDAVVYVRGHTTPGDGGEGIFRWDPADDRKMVVSAAVVSAGNGYMQGGELQVLGGRGVPAARMLITKIANTGAVVTVEVVVPGKYIQQPAHPPKLREAGGGAGCILSLQYGPADDDGVCIAPRGATVGRWLRDAPPGVSNVCWFGADRSGSTDASKAFHAAIGAWGVGGRSDVIYHGSVVVPPGQYALSQPVILQNGSRLCGSGRGSCYLNATGTGSSPLITTFPKMDSQAAMATNWIRRKRVVIRDMTLTGNCQHAIQLCAASESEIKSVSVDCKTTSHAIFSEDSFNCVIDSVATFGALVHPDSACLYLGRDSNAYAVNSFRTSNNACKYGIVIGSGPEMGGFAGGGVAGHGISINDACLQGHTETALWVQGNGYGGTTVSGLYTEACIQSIRLGDFANRRMAIGVSISGGMIGGAVAAMPGTATVFLDYARGVHISGVRLYGSNNKAALLFNAARDVHIVGVGYDWDGLLYDQLRIAPGGYSPRGFFMVTVGAPPYGETSLVMQPADYGKTLRRMWVDTEGNWRSAALPLASL